MCSNEIQNTADQDTLQADLDSLAEWETKWAMEFHPAKCSTLSATRSRQKLEPSYQLHGQQLENVPTIKYLGVEIKENLKWSNHITSITNKANKTLGFVRRNLKVGNKRAKETAYNALIRPKLEYAASVWDPHTQADMKTLEKVQRRAARWVTSRYRQTSCVISILTSTGQHSKIGEKKHDWNYSTNSIKAWLPSTPGTYQRHPTTGAVRGKTTPPATTFLAAELNIGKCHSFLDHPWVECSAGGDHGGRVAGQFQVQAHPSHLTPPTPSPHAHSLPHPKSPLSSPTTPISSPLILNKNGKWDFWAWRATHYCINATEPSKKWCWLYKRKKKIRLSTYLITYWFGCCSLWGVGGGGGLLRCNRRARAREYIIMCVCVRSRVCVICVNNNHIWFYVCVYHMFAWAHTNTLAQTDR